MNWKTKAGQVIPLSEMGDTHLLNTAKMLLRNFSDCPDKRVCYLYLKEMKAELDKRNIQFALPSFLSLSLPEVMSIDEIPLWVAHIWE